MSRIRQMMKTPFRSAEQFNLVLGRKFFKNNSTLLGNISGRTKHYISSKTSDISDNSNLDKGGEGIRRTSIEYDEDFVDEFREKCIKLLDESDDCLTVGEGDRLRARDLRTPLFNFKEELPEIQKFVTEEVLDWLEDYYGCYAKPVFLKVDERLPSDFDPSELPATAVETWHMDPFSSDMIKLFVPLVDIDESYGPTHVIAEQPTKELMEDYNYSDLRYGKVDLEDVGVEKLTGSKGTAAFADICSCLHRAGKPEPGKKRYVLQIAFLPSSTPLSDNWLDNEEYMLPDRELQGYRRLFL